MKALLLHPPLLSPVVWSRLEPLIQRAGHDTVTPDLREPVRSGWWEAARDAAAAACPDADVVIAHSGAGALVPVVCQAVRRVEAVVLIDAVLPRPDGECRTPAELRDLVSDMAENGVVPPWTSWWGEDTLVSLVPDEDDRRALVDSAPSLPLSFFDVTVPAPAGWEPARCVYVRLSAAYDAELEAAASRGWETAAREGQHLDPLCEPASVARVVLAHLRPT